MRHRILPVLVWLPWGIPAPGPIRTGMAEHGLVAASDGRTIWLSRDRGMSWRRIASPADETHRASHPVQKVVLCGGRVLWAQSRTVFATVETAAAPVPVLECGGEVSDLISGPQHRVAVVESSRIWISTDCGTRWRRMMPPFPVRRAAFGPKGVLAAAGVRTVGLLAGRWIVRNMGQPILDLAFQGRTGLLLATEQALWRLETKGLTPQPRSPVAAVSIRRLIQSPRGIVWALGTEVWIVSGTHLRPAGFGLPDGATILGGGRMAADQPGRLLRPRWIRWKGSHLSAHGACGPPPEPPAHPLSPARAAASLPKLVLQATGRGGFGTRLWNVEIAAVWRPGSTEPNLAEQSWMLHVNSRTWWRARLKQWKTCQILWHLTGQAKCNAICQAALYLAAQEARASLGPP